MNDPNAIDKFNKCKTAFTKAGLFVSISMQGTPRFWVGPKKHARDFESIISKHYRTNTQNKCPISSFYTLVEVEAFYKGFCIASKQKSLL